MEVEMLTLEQCDDAPVGPRRTDPTLHYDSTGFNEFGLSPEHLATFFRGCLRAARLVRQDDVPWSP